jgi:SAM-dependent methyltransferase
VRRRALAFLVCPACQGTLRERAQREQGDDIVEGTLVCTGCGRSHPIVRGVPRFTVRDSRGRMQRHFAWQARAFRSMGSRASDLPVQLASFVAPLAAADFAGRCVADVGCGSGRFARAAASWDARDVLAFDASDAVDAARVTTEDQPQVHVVQADLRQLPLRRGGAAQVDLAFAIGVLHHLADPAGGLAAIADAVRGGGSVCAWVYAREGNEWLARYGDPVRARVTSRLPPAAAYGVSFALAALVHGAAKLARTRLDYLAWLARFPLRHTHAVVHDHLTTSLTHYVTRADFASWFDKAGLADVRIRPRNGNSWTGVGRSPSRRHA